MYLPKSNVEEGGSNRMHVMVWGIEAISHGVWGTMVCFFLIFLCLGPSCVCVSHFSSTISGTS